MPLNRYDANCQQCPRLAQFLRTVKTQYPDYFCQPVPNFGDEKAEILLIGLAPGKHGANATGRPFTGDYAGVLLFETLHHFGLANRADGISIDDGMQLNNIRICNSVKCLPPDNKPNSAEINTCNQYLKAELLDEKLKVLISLGGIAHRATLKALGLPLSKYPFAHNATYDLPCGRRLIASYHCSRYNTQTKRLNTEMFRAVFANALEGLA